DGARAQRGLAQRHRIVVGVVVLGPRPPRSGMDAIGDGAQILAEPRGEAELRPRRDRLAGTLRERDVDGAGDLLRLWRRLDVLDVPPGEALRPLAGAAARALRIAERQSHFESEVRAQEVGKVGA